MNNNQTNNSSESTSQKAITFEEDFKARAKKKTEEKRRSYSSLVGFTTDGFTASPEYKSPFASYEPVSTPESTATSKTGKEIKDNIRDVLSLKHGPLNTKNLFDDIDDISIENNIPTAQSAIKSNIEKGFLSKDYKNRFPYMLDGLSLSYAAAEIGNNKEVTKAREAAYTEDESFAKKLKEQLATDRFSELEKMTKALLKGEKLPSLSDGYSFSNKNSQNTGGKRYVGVKSGNLYLRSAPGTSNSILDKMPRGTEVDFTGRKTSVDGIGWAEVSHNGNKGWVAADYLKTSRPQTNSPSRDTINFQNTSNTQNNSKAYLTDYEVLQKAFNDVGDFDGKYGLQCPDAVKWFISTLTDLSPKNGDGYLQAKEIASQRNDLEVTNIPSAPSVFSVAPGTYGPGIKDGGVSDEESGHTGIVLDCKRLDDGQYEITYFHTYNGLNKNGYNSAIVTKKFKPSNDVTYVNIGKYIKQLG